MLERLEAADCYAKLLPFLQVAERAFEAFLGDAQHFRSEADTADIQGQLEYHSCPLTALQHLGFVDADVAKPGGGGETPVHQSRRLDLQAVGVGGHQAQYGPVFLTRADHQVVRRVTVNHVDLDAVEDNGTGLSRGGGIDLPGPVLDAFFTGQ